MKYTVSDSTLQYKVGLTLSFLSLISRGVGGIQKGNTSIYSTRVKVDLDDQAFQLEGRAIHYAKTMTRYLTERALQLYYYTEILGKHVDFDHKALIKKLLRFEGTNADRASQENWSALRAVSYTHLTLPTIYSV